MLWSIALVLFTVDVDARPAPPAQSATPARPAAETATSTAPSSDAAAAIAAGTDPRIPINEAQLDGRYEDALFVVESTLRSQPELARRLGLDYLRGHLLQQLGRLESAHDAFAEALNSPLFSDYSRYWLARHQARTGHPEVASGLLATLLSTGAAEPLVQPATRLLADSIEHGGDCRLLRGRGDWDLPRGERRLLDLVAAECALDANDRTAAGDTLVALVREERNDDVARRAALHLANSLPELAGQPENARRIGLTLHQHREFDRAEPYLLLYLGSEDARRATQKERYEAGYALARSHFWRENYPAAADAFQALLADPLEPETAARVLYQKGRSQELHGDWETALVTFESSRAIDPQGRWASAAILSNLRIYWRCGDEPEALAAYAQLRSRNAWRDLMGRGALFLASSDIVRRRGDRARAWLDDASRSGSASDAELSYWYGRLAEVDGNLGEAVSRYARAARHDNNPFATAARDRISQPELQGSARQLGLQLARRGSSAALRDARTLLAGQPEEAQVASALIARLQSDARLRKALEMRRVPVEEWPIWGKPLRQQDELLLALGAWSPAPKRVSRHFPIADAALAFTSSQMLARRGAVNHSVYIAEVLQNGLFDSLPASLVPTDYRRLLYPDPYASLIRAEAGPREVPASLVSSIIREESRFDPDALSSASARGLTQFVLPTARRLAPRIGRDGIEARDLHDPPVSVALGAAYLEELIELFDGHLAAVVSAYNAGERQAMLWKSYCYSREPVEFITKIGFPETRAYVQRVLTGEAHYRELYPSGYRPPAASPVETTTGGSSPGSPSR